MCAAHIAYTLEMLLYCFLLSVEIKLLEINYEIMNYEILLNQCCDSGFIPFLLMLDMQMLSFM